MISVKPLVKPIYSELKQAVGYVIELQCYVEANPFPNAEQMKWIRGNRAISVSSGRYVQAGLCEKVPNVLSRCHTKRRMDGFFLKKFFFEFFFFFNFF